MGYSPWGHKGTTEQLSTHARTLQALMGLRDFLPHSLSTQSPLTQSRDATHWLTIPKRPSRDVF